MGRLLLVAAVFSGFFLGDVTLAEDWAHWRGPTYNGVAGKSPALVDSFGQDGPKKLWESEVLAPKGGIGHGSVTIADGRAYTYTNSRFRESVTERVLSARSFGRTGYASDMPKQLLDAVEKARVSDELKGIRDRRQRRTWVNNWLKEHVTQENRRFRGAAQARLNAGDRALPIDVLAKLAPIKDREFPDQAAFDAWLKENNIDGKHHDNIRRLLTTQKNVAKDFVFCLDAETGKTLWKKGLDAWHMGWSASFSPTVSDGKCYVMGSAAFLYCFDAKTGREIWKSEFIGRQGNRHNRSSPALVLDGVAIVCTAANAVGIDVETGKTLWKQKGGGSETTSPVPWTAGGKTYALIAASGKVSAFEPKSGKIAWSVRTKYEGASPTVVGKHLALVTTRQRGSVSLYEMTQDEPKMVWSVPFSDGYTSPTIHDGHVYAFGEGYSRPHRGRGVCVEIATGKAAWTQPVDTAQHSSAIVADGKIILIVGNSLRLVKPTPEKYTELGKATLGLSQWTSPAFVDGKVYLRTGKSVVCYDLRK